MRAPLIALAALPLLAGCVSTVKSVATAPFKAVGQVADWTTTSQAVERRARVGKSVGHGGGGPVFPISS